MASSTKSKRKLRQETIHVSYYKNRLHDGLIIKESQLAARQKRGQTVKLGHVLVGRRFREFLRKVRIQNV